MEDEGFVDDDLVEAAALRYVALHGDNSLPLLRERTRLAAASGDPLLALTWREILQLAERIVAEMDNE